MAKSRIGLASSSSCLTEGGSYLLGRLVVPSFRSGPSGLSSLTTRLCDLQAHLRSCIVFPSSKEWAKECPSLDGLCGPRHEINATPAARYVQCVLWDSGGIYREICVEFDGATRYGRFQDFGNRTIIDACICPSQLIVIISSFLSFKQLVPFCLSYMFFSRELWV